MYLPTVDGSPATKSLDEEAIKVAGGSETILLVEDKRLVRDIARTVLEDGGYEVLTASNGHEALRQCEAHKGTIHLLLTDVVMPRMNGRELASRVRSTRPEIRVILMSGYTKEPEPFPESEAGDPDFLQKPVLPLDLLRTVRNVLDRE